jgi:hypothetical protein
VVSARDANASAAGIASNLSGPALASQFNDPAAAPRAPNVVTVVVPGVIDAGATATMRSEHGGFGHDDTNVPILPTHSSKRLMRRRSSCRSGRSIKRAARCSDSTEPAPARCRSAGAARVRIVRQRMGGDTAHLSGQGT